MTRVLKPILGLAALAATVVAAPAMAQSYTSYYDSNPGGPGVRGYYSAQTYESESRSGGYGYADGRADGYAYGQTYAPQGYQQGGYYQQGHAPQGYGYGYQHGYRGVGPAIPETEVRAYVATGGHATGSGRARSYGYPAYGYGQGYGYGRPGAHRGGYSYGHSGSYGSGQYGGDYRDYHRGDRYSDGRPGHYDYERSGHGYRDRYGYNDDRPPRGDYRYDYDYRYDRDRDCDCLDVYLYDR